MTLAGLADAGIARCGRRAIDLLEAASWRAGSLPVKFSGTGYWRCVCVNELLAVAFQVEV
jgi:hypothetical protein